MIKDRHLITKDTNPLPCDLIVADGSKTKAVWERAEPLVAHEAKLPLGRVLFSEKLKYNLLSVDDLVEKGYVFVLQKEKSHVKCPDGTAIPLKRRNKMFQMQVETAPVQAFLTKATEHERWCHFGPAGSCEKCLQEKGKSLSHKKARKSEYFAKKYMECVHVDLIGPIKPVSYSGMKWLAVFVDDFTGETTVIPLKNKLAITTSKCLQEFIDLRGKMEILRSDNGPEFKGSSAAFCRKKGIRRRFSTPYILYASGKWARGTF